MTTDHTATLTAAHFDVRRIPCRIKHAQIFQRWADLPVGAFFILVNDHDPIPLYYQFKALFADAFEWEYLVDGPTEFQVKITRRAPTPVNVPPPPPRRASNPDTAGPEPILDLRGLEPPLPMIHILNALESVAAGGSFRARTDRQPVHLFPELASRGARYSTESQPDASWITTVTRG